ncbi:MAG: rhomboid family intramembrane serine protease [Bacteroidia bacterium]|nr:rhomboid family intramembrane serine protease [Bacteroidia bacterium]MCZ2247402.1 rhomboid family intramembrane serine protease [Bacteroidia bacterium]
MIEELKYKYKTGDNITKLIFINAIVFVALGLLSLIGVLFKVQTNLNFLPYLSLPSKPFVLLHYPWTLFTYMFIHQGFFHILFNMIMLYFGGRIFSDFLGNSRVVPMYIGGGLMGALLYLLLYNTLPVFADINISAQLLGSSAAVLAIFFAIAAYLPNYEVGLILLGFVKLKYIALFLFIIDLLSIDKGNPGGHIAHIGGALFGILYVYGLKRGYDFTSYFNKFTTKISDLFSRKRESKMKVVYKQTSNKANSKSNNKTKQEIIDAILDKISKSGYDSLTHEERETIFKISKEE